MDDTLKEEDRSGSEVFYGVGGTPVDERDEGHDMGQGGWRGGWVNGPDNQRS